MLALDTKGRAAPLLLLAAAATVSVSGVLLWGLWRRFRKPGNEEQAASSGDDGIEAVPAVQPISPHRSDTHEHGHHHHHHSSRAKPSRSTRSSTKREPTILHHAGHGETERLLPSRAATQPVYSSHSHTHPHHSHTDSSAHHEHSSQILQFHVTHDEPLPIDQYQEESPTHERRTRGSVSPTLFPGTSGHHGRDSYHAHGGSIHRAVTDSAVIDDFSRHLHQNSIDILSGVESGGPVDAVYDGPGKHYREMARDALRLRKVALENSQRSFRSGRKAEARQLSEEGRLHEGRAKQYNAQAAAEIFQCYNPRYYSASSTSPPFSRCDLHGLHVEEALQYAREHLTRCRQAGVEKTMLIVGKGSHSQAGGARIKPAIMQMMANTGGVIAALHEKNEGCIVVEFARGY
ncbi:hypothetical protein M0805_004604 [Coniferiporia weirii]|nr:hypothetical protein M0805_004604 [Coniferiporia weirii]